MKAMIEAPLRGFRIIRVGPANQSEYDLDGCCYPPAEYSSQNLNHDCTQNWTSQYKKLNFSDNKPSGEYIFFQMTHTTDEIRCSSNISDDCVFQIIFIVAKHDYIINSSVTIFQRIE